MRRLRRSRQRRIEKRKKLRDRAIAAGTVAVITLGTGTALHKTLAAIPPDPHHLQVSPDADADLLGDAEETAIGYQVFRADQNRNEISDGVELAKRCAADINDLPWEEHALPGQTYKWCQMQYGLEICDICGETVNMGNAGIVNPRLGLSVDCPLIATHYMGHGSFGYAGNYGGQPLHVGRIDVASLTRALELKFPHDPNEHQLPLDYVVKPAGQLAPDANDLDGDLLADTEELAAGFNLYDADQDNDLTPDGIQFAKQCHDVIDALPVYDPNSEEPEPNEPYKISYFLRGLELCEICGQSVNMGHWRLVNPNLAISMDTYDIACHYMSHGSFSYSGLDYDSPHDPFHNGRIDIALLAKILQMPRRCGHLGTMYLPGDHNKDCRENFTDFADFADKWLQGTDPAQKDSGEPQIAYNIEECDRLAKPPPQDPPVADQTFSARVEGRYIRFADMIHANCCPDKIQLEMTVSTFLIKILEAEYTTQPCDCICDFPASAALGPFEDGTYMLKVYRRTNDSEEQFIGETTLTIGSG